MGVDVWASGLILIELLTGKNKSFFQGNTKEDVLNNIKENNNIKLASDITAETREIISLLLETDPK